MRVINYSNARSQLKSVIDKVIDDDDVVIISRRDADDAVVMSLDHYNGLMETLHLLGNPANAVQLHTSIGQYRSGDTFERGLVED